MKNGKNITRRKSLPFKMLAFPAILGSMIEREVNCNSQFMLQILPQIANEMRQHLHLIPCQERIYLVMENFRGCGRKARDGYTRHLLEELNIEFIQQSAWLTKS